MNIHKTIAIVSVVFAILFSAASVMGAVTIVNDTTLFNNAQSSGLWSGLIKMSTDSTNSDIGISNSGTPALTKDYHSWRNGQTPDYLLSDQVTMAYVTVVSSVNEAEESVITMSIGNVSGAFPDASTKSVTTTYTPSSTLWIGILSGAPSDSFGTPTFDVFNMMSNGQSIPGSVNVSGSGFDGFMIATDNSINFSGWIRTSQNGAMDAHNGIEAQFKVFGDNTLDAIPEPGVAALIGVAGILMLFRKRR